MKIVEVCCCGASCEVEQPEMLSTNVDKARDFVKQWRLDHRHEAPERITTTTFDTSHVGLDT